jgi:hypothetical protein
MIFVGHKRHKRTTKKTIISFKYFVHLLELRGKRILVLYPFFLVLRTEISIIEDREYYSSEAATPLFVISCFITEGLKYYTETVE